jgi:hypothetical protein
MEKRQTQDKDTASYLMLWRDIFIDTLKYYVRIDMDKSDPKLHALLFESTTCFWHINPDDLDTNQRYVRLRNQMKDLAGTNPTGDSLSLEERAMQMGDSLTSEAENKQLRKLHAWSDHATAYIRGLEVNYHVYEDKDRKKHHTCLVQQIQLIEL